VRAIRKTSLDGSRGTPIALTHRMTMKTRIRLVALIVLVVGLAACHGGRGHYKANARGISTATATK